MPHPIVIAHRGACGYRPEHTLASYDLAIDLGADFIEPDLVSTSDGTLVARHENAIAIVESASGSIIEATTDVAARPEFASRKTTKTIDGKSMTGWFTEDFTIDELRTLRARERLPLLRPGNAAWDGLSGIPTLEEIIDLVKRRSMELGRQIGIYPETKHPTYFQSIGLPLEPSLLESLHGSGFNGPDSPVFIQSFEVGNLRRLAERTSLPLIQLIGEEPPFDQLISGTRFSHTDMVSPSGLSRIREYAAGIGPSRYQVLNANGRREKVTLVDRAHGAGLLVHVWTFRSENHFLPPEFRCGDPSSADYPRDHGNTAAELETFFNLDVDGVFADFPDVAVRVRDEILVRAGRKDPS